MAALLSMAAVLVFGVGFAHSVLGERYILRRLLRRSDLPHLFGGSEFTARTLRFAWHVTTIAWWRLAAILVLLARASSSFQNLSWVLAITFLVSGAITLIFSRGRHLAWMVFFLIGGVCLYAATAPVDR